jgi:phage tail sheath protein FI
MPQYLAPGVYVEEVPSAVRPIAGVGTSTAGFVGLVPDALVLPPYATVKVPNESPEEKPDGQKKILQLRLYPVLTTSGTFMVKVNGQEDKNATLRNDDTALKASVELDTAPKSTDTVTVEYYAVSPLQIRGEAVGAGDGRAVKFRLAGYPIDTVASSFSFMVAGKSATPPPTVSNETANLVSYITFRNAPGAGEAITGNYVAFGRTFSPVGSGKPTLCTNFSEFKKAFGDFSTDSGQQALAHAVFGFFHNGGTRCFVMRYATTGDLQKQTALDPFEAIDEISLVAAPGSSDTIVWTNVLGHCAKTNNRFAILDSPSITVNPTASDSHPANSTYGAYYLPRIQVFDPATKAMNPDGPGLAYVAPSGHLAGIYARVDAIRGVHNAPANEVVQGAVGLEWPISNAVQDGLNPSGLNCIRDLNGNIRVWGARTIGGDANIEFKYVNVRRLFLFLRKSIEQGTQWVVFEPNSPALWQKITRNVTAFLTSVWRDGALFGTTAAEAFYVKCDAETNPPELRDLGQVVTEIGVAIVRPAEFVIFRISQFSGTGT